MIELKGTREEIAKAISAISETYPAHIVMQLDIGEWHFAENGVDVLVLIKGEENEKNHDQDDRRNEV